MKKLLAFLLLACAIFAQAQTTIAPGGAVYSNTTGAFVGFVNRATGVEEAIGRRVTQAVAPACTTNCGTGPSMVGSDTAMTLTMGATGVPTTTWVITFVTPWAAAPACIVIPALNAMALNKAPIAVQTTTTTITVNTTSAAGNSDKYHILCMGVG